MVNTFNKKANTKEDQPKPQTSKENLLQSNLTRRPVQPGRGPRSAIGVGQIVAENIVVATQTVRVKRVAVAVAVVERGERVA